MIDFKTLGVWQKAHQLTLSIYHATENLPQSERFGLISQMQRSSASIPTNIAEGCGRDSDKELVRFCNIAMGSAAELEYQIILTHDLGMIDDTTHQRLSKQLDEVKRMLFGFIRSVKRRL